MDLQFWQSTQSPKFTMTQNRNSLPITVFISDDSTTESDSSNLEWLGPENQLGLEPEFGLQRNAQMNMQVALDKKGENKDKEATVKCW